MTNSQLHILSFVCLALAVCVGEDALAEASVAEIRPVETERAEFVLARADGQTRDADYRFEELHHFLRLTPPYVTTLNDEEIVEVAVVFWYGSEDCLDIETWIYGWVPEAPPSVRFVRIPWVMSRDTQTHAQLYYTYQHLVLDGVMEESEVFNAHVFSAIHDIRRNTSLLQEDEIQRFFARFGVDEATFSEAWNSFRVAARVQRAWRLTEEYGVSRGPVPAFIVNGKYLINTAIVREPATLFDVIDELVERESAP